MKFELYVELDEEAHDEGLTPENGFANVIVNTTDGRCYGINVWTYDFVKTAAAQNKTHNENLAGFYLTPPDLMVERISQEELEKVVADMFTESEYLEDVLSDSVFGVYFDQPWTDALDYDDCGEEIEEAFVEHLGEHMLAQMEPALLGVHQAKQEAVFVLANESCALVSLDHTSENFPNASYYPNLKSFWQHVLRADYKEA